MKIVCIKKYRSTNLMYELTYGKVYDALQRHLSSWWGGEDKDPETNLSHLAHAGCCLLFLLS